MKENVRKKQTLAAMILFAVIFALTSIGVLGATSARAASTAFGINYAESFNSNGGSPAGVGNGIIRIATTGGYSQKASWGVMQTVTKVSDGADGFLTNESLLVVKKTGEAAKTAKEWNTTNANNIKRIAGYGGSLIIYFDKQDTIGQKDIEYITLKSGFVLGNGASASWSDETPATAITESALTSDVTIYANQKSKTFEPAVKGMPTAMAEGALVVKTAPTSVEFQQNSTFNPEGMVITAKLNDDSVKDVAVTADMVSYDFSEPGEADVTVSYGGGTVVQKVTVTEELDASFTIKPGYKTEYFFGESLDTTTLNFEITTNRGNKRDATYADVKSNLKITGFDTTLVPKGGTKFEQTVTLQIGEMTAQTFKIEIDDVEVDKPITPVYNTDASKSLEVKFFVAGSVTGLAKDIWGVHNAEFAKDKIFISYKIGDTVYENKTVQEIQAAHGATSMPRAMYTYEDVSGGFNLVLRFHMDDHKVLKPADITRITVKRGLYWYNGGPTGFTDRLDEVALLEDAYFDIASGQSVKATKTFTVTGAPTKVKYAVGEKFDPAGLTASATYVDGTSGAVTITEDMCSYDFSTAGTNKSIKINYNGKEHTINGIEAVGVKTVTLKSAPTKLAYNLSEKIDLTGAKLDVTMTDGTKKVVDVEESMLGKYDAFVVGEKEIEIKFSTFTFKFKATYTDAHPDSHITVSNNSNVFLENKTLAVTLHFTNISDSRRAIWHIEKATNAKEKIWFFCKIGDSEEYVWKSIGELMINGSDGKPMVARVNAYGDTLEFHLDSADLLKTNVKQIKIQEGFYLCKAPANSWGADGSANYTYMENAIFRHEVIIENNDGRKWIRPFATGDDSLTIISQPTKTTYTVGEDVDPMGLKIKVKYLDGFTEEIIITVNEIPMRKLNKVGDAVAVTAVFNGRQFTFNVKVVEEAEEPVVTPKPDKKGCGSSITYTSVIIAMVLLFGAVIVTVKRKKKED